MSCPNPCASRPANRCPTSVPRNNDAKNSPPRNPKPSEMIDAAHFASSTVAMNPSDTPSARSACSAPCPADSTCGDSIATGTSNTPPIAGRSQSGSRIRRVHASTSATARITAIPISAQIAPSPA